MRTASAWPEGSIFEALSLDEQTVPEATVAEIFEGYPKTIALLNNRGIVTEEDLVNHLHTLPTRCAAIYGDWVIAKYE